MNLSNSYAVNDIHLIPFKSRFESALKEPLIQKCMILSQLIQESITTNNKEMQSIFMPLIEDIFSFGSHSTTSEWGLKLISRSFNPREFDAIFAFLHINGNLFSLIRHLMTDPLNRYEFPKSCLPMPTKLSLEEGVIPSFYSNKISHGFANAISLNPLEFYLFHFSYYMLNNSSNQYFQHNPYFYEHVNNVNSNSWNILYYGLLELYLSYFVGCSESESHSHPNQCSHPSLWQSLSSTTSSLLHLGTASNTASPKQVSSPTSTLFKSSILNLKPLSSSDNHLENNDYSFQRIAHDCLGTEIGKCETFLLIVTELWLNHAIPHSLNVKHSSPSKQNVFTPNSDHMRAVRMLIKHLHYFSNSYNKRETIGIMDVNSPLDDIKRSIWSPKYLFQKKLYSFLRLSFDRWPNDTSFRLPLETWLSYVQPWRYSTQSQARLNSESDDRDVTNVSTEGSSAIVDHRWKQFICDNLLFYTVILRQLIPRFSKLLDLSASKNALMLFRLTKVFSQQNLAQFIREAENSVMNNETSILQNSWVTNTRASLLSPAIRHQNVSSFVGNFRHPLMELESKNFEYNPLFCHSIKPIIMQLLAEISSAQNIVNDMITSANNKFNISSNSNSSFFATIKAFFQLNDDFSEINDNKRFLIEKNKTKNHLTVASLQLSQLFEVPEMDQNETLSENSITSIRRRNLNTDYLTPNQLSRNVTYEDDPNGTPKLSSIGRYQVLNKLYKPELATIEGNPDEQPVRTFEVFYLVRLFLVISIWINTKYSHKIQQLYNRTDLIGVFFRQLVSGPVSYTKVVKNASFRPPERVKQVLAARINLRFMANKYYICYVSIILFLVYISKYSLISFLFLAFFMLFTYLLTKSILIYLSSSDIQQYGSPVQQ